jgi:hypothetical protein
MILKAIGKPWSVAGEAPPRKAKVSKLTQKSFGIGRVFSLLILKSVVLLSMGHITLPCCIGYDKKLKINDEGNLPVACCCRRVLCETPFSQKLTVRLIMPIWPHVFSALKKKTSWEKI